MAGLTGAGATDKSSSNGEQTAHIAAAGPQELAIRNQFANLSQSQSQALQQLLANLQQNMNPSSGIGSIALSAGDQQALDAAYAGQEQGLRRFGNLMGQDLAGTRGLNPSDTPVSEAVLRETLPAMANLQGMKAQEGLNLGMGLKQFNEGARQFNIGSLLSGTQATPAAGLNLMNGLQQERIAGMSKAYTNEQRDRASWLNRMKGVSEIYNNIGQGTAGFAKSDIRLKRDIRPVSWHWKDGASKEHLGVIAQEVQQSHPHLVSRHPHDGDLMVDYGAMVAMLLAEREWLYSQLTGQVDTPRPQPERGVVGLDAPAQVGGSHTARAIHHKESALDS